MAIRKNFTGDLFAPDEGLVPAEASNETVQESRDKTTESMPPMDEAGTGNTPERPERKELSSGSTVTIAESPNNTHNKHHKKTYHYPLKRHSGRTDETKSKRLNLLIRPGVLKEFSKIAYMQQTSVNELINRLIAEHNEKESGTIRQYNRLFKDKS
ncbi:MAG: hypothetical protein HGB04_10505 [Chlorobiaceae bacterium]|nr:hypothetical protein [Chlorobiaceae bacterium]